MKVQEPESTLTRFRAKYVEVDSGCWLWTASDNGRGYGKFFADGKRVYAHRFSYQVHRGPIPDGLQIDHLCRNPRCVNPDHLEPVSCGKNVQRGNAAMRTLVCKHGHRRYGWSKGVRYCLECHRLRSKRERPLRKEYHQKYGRRWRAEKRGGPPQPTPEDRTHCPKGHPYSGDNLYIRPSGKKKGYRECRACRADYVKANRDKMNEYNRRYRARQKRMDEGYKKVKALVDKAFGE